MGYSQPPVASLQTLDNRSRVLSFPSTSHPLNSVAVNVRAPATPYLNKIVRTQQGWEGWGACVSYHSPGEFFGEFLRFHRLSVDFARFPLCKETVFVISGRELSLYSNPGISRLKELTSIMGGRDRDAVELAVDLGARLHGWDGDLCVEAHQEIVESPI
jgi:hypothetical protein